VTPTHVTHSDAPRIGDKYKCAESDATYLLVGTTDYLAYLIDLELGRSWTDGVPLEVEESDSELYTDILKTTYEDNVFTKPMED